ncbi:13953_t:CDS:2, partial [Gigaspora margarita]
KEYHYPAWVSVTRVSCDKTKEHSDEYYCLASIKGARQFAQTFSDIFIIVSQDDKSEIGLGIPVVHHQLITHTKDISSLVSNDQYFGILKINNNIKSILILLVGRGPNENPCYFKNIQSYCKPFRKFNLDYLTVHMHALEQSKYNPVERGMSILSSKLAGIILPINHFGNHLDSQGKTIDTKLAAQNFAMLAYIAKYKYLLHPSPHRRPKKNQHTSSELVVEFAYSKEIDNFGTLHSEQNR